jgi:hypothetical protein
MQRWRIGFPLLALALAAALIFSVSGMAAPGGNSAASIAGSFGDSCRDFAAHSSKDISHVVLRYADGRMVKDETIGSPDYSIDGASGDELEFAIVKSGTTTQTFNCTRPTSPPTAILEVKTPETCFTWDDGSVACDGTAARTTWTHSTTALGFGYVAFGCGWPDDQSCVQHEMPCGQKDFYSLCRITYTFRGTSSTDPDGDIVSWSLDFGDGTSTGGDWKTNPPNEVSHEYLIHNCPTCTRDPATLTVTDSAGQADSDAQFVLHVYPD